MTTLSISSRSSGVLTAQTLEQAQARTGGSKGNKGAEAAAAVQAEIDAGSLRVVTAMRDGRPVPGALRPADVEEIEAIVAREVLRASRFPLIRFASSSVSRTESGYDVRGQLTLVGATREVAFTARRDAGRLALELSLHQPEYGIRPYRAMLGALRVKPDVIVRAAIPVEGLP